MRLIDADLFDKALADAQAKCKKSGGNFRYGVLSNVRANLLKQPTVDALPVVHGKWEQEDNIFDDQTFICTVCHEPWVLIDGTPEDNNMHFCPNCGAKM